MPGEAPHRVVIFHEQPASFADTAAQVAQGVGWTPEQFDLVVLGRAGAVVASLGTPHAHTPRSHEYTVQPLLSQAAHMGVPIALLSERRDAQRFVNRDTSDILIPENPASRVAPVLRAWFMALSARTR
jgi:hypothetical protein